MVAVSALGFMGRLGWAELAIIVLVLLLVFGAGRLPGLARSLGRSLHACRKSMKQLGNGARDQDRS